MHRLDYGQPPTRPPKTNDGRRHYKLHASIIEFVTVDDVMNVRYATSLGSVKFDSFQSRCGLYYLWLYGCELDDVNLFPLYLCSLRG